MNNKSLRRFLSLFLMLLVALFVSIDINATNVTELDGAKYYVKKVKEENTLAYGVKHATHISYSSVAEGQTSGAAAGHGGGGIFLPNKYYPQQVNILEVPSSENIRITPWAFIKPFEWTLKTVKEMISNYEEQNPGYRVIAAINGDFFDINKQKNFPLTPTGVHVSDGNFYKSSQSKTIGFKNDGSIKPLIGNQRFTRTEKMILAIYENNQIIKEFSIDKINQYPGDNEIAIFYANRNDNKEAVPVAVNDAFIVENAEYALPHSKDDFYGLGTISKIGDEVLGDGQFAIVSKNPEVTEALGEGVRIRTQFEFTGEFADIKNAIGVGETILYEKKFTGSDLNRHPRTMIGVREDGTIIMTVVDGRQPSKGMYGATAAEMAAILSHYGAIEGYNLDGGGSSTMIIVKGGELEVVNSPSDGRERSDANCIIISAKVPTIDYSVTDISKTQLTINAKVTDKNGFDFDKLYVGIGSEIKEVIDGKAIFENLERNKKYIYKFYYQKDGKFIDFAIEDNVYTSKTLPEINYFNLSYNGKHLVMKVNFFNPDNAIVRAIAYIDNKPAGIIINDGIANFYNFDKEIIDISFNITYNLNDGSGDHLVIIKDVGMKIGIDIFMEMAIAKVNRAIHSIYE